MQIEINGQKYDIIIEKKKSTKNTYLRVKEDLKIYVTTNTFTSDKLIIEILKNNYKSIEKMLAKRLSKKSQEGYFYYLGKRYDIIYTNDKNITVGEQKVFLPHELDIDKWYKRQASSLFLEHLNNIYNNFSKKIPYPSLRIRKMTSRWGVCNTKEKIITLNLELIKKDLKYLDYVIVHELSHLVEANHSSSFWSVVEQNQKDYKILRKELKE